jgi:hypothetical protein
MTPKEFHHLCANHDWFYLFSDDQRYWRAGQAEARILANAIAAQPEFTEQWNAWITWLNDPDPAKHAPECPAE